MKCRHANSPPCPAYPRSSMARCAASLASFGSGELIISLREFYHLELLNKVYVQNYLRNHWVDSQDEFNEVS